MNTLPVARLFHGFPFSSLRILAFQFSVFRSSLHLNDLDSGVSSILRAFSQPPGPIAQQGAFLEKHGLCVEVSLMGWDTFGCVEVLWQRATGPGGLIS